MKTLLLILILAASTFGNICGDTIGASGRAVYSLAPGLYIGIPRARIQFNNSFAVTNPFGYYSLRIPNCGMYEATATAKWFVFDPQFFALPVPDLDTLNLDFIAHSGN